MKSTKPHDVFLSFNPKDSGLAHLVIDSFSGHGVHVYSLSDLAPGTSIEKELRAELIESVAVVLLVTPNSVNSLNLAFEAGMAMGWSKPIFVLFSGINQSEVPRFLNVFHVFSVDNVADVAKAVRKAAASFTDQEADLLRQLYADHGTPVDRLVLEQVELAALTNEFNRQSGLQVGGERIARELMRLRKGKRLPKLKPVSQRA